MAALPAAVAVAERTGLLEPLDAAGAIPVSLGLGIAAVALARGARARVERTIGRVGGRRAARAGTVLGGAAICVGIAGAIAVGVYLSLGRFVD